MIGGWWQIGGRSKTGGRAHYVQRGLSRRRDLQTTKTWNHHVKESMDNFLSPGIQRAAGRVHHVWHTLHTTLVREARQIRAENVKSFTTREESADRSRHKKDMLRQKVFDLYARARTPVTACRRAHVCTVHQRIHNKINKKNIH